MTGTADRARRLRSRVVVIFGASSGIGLAAALASAHQGDHVVLVARGPESLARAVEQCQTAGAASAKAYPGDIGGQDTVRSILGDVVAQHGHLDAVIVSAGVVAYGRFEDVPAEVFDRVLTTNISGTANVARAALPILRNQGSGHLILIGSLLGHMVPPYMSPYAVSKWAVRGLARLLQIENRDRPNVHISYVAPGGVDTPIYVQAGNYLGQVGRPPPPVATPERLGEVIIGLLDRPRRQVHTPLTNPLIIFGYTAFPRLFDAIVTPLFEIAATDQRRRVEPGTGNVFTATEEGNRLRGHHGSVTLSIAAGALIKLREAAKDTVSR